MKKKNKDKVFVRRTSSKGQDLAMQESADALYRQQYVDEEIVIINEEDTSANKLKISERPKMMKLIWMILNNQVDTVYAFDRTRLFRDFYEANYFVALCRKNNVRIFFTSASNGHQQATDSTLIEGVLNIVSDIEGKNIARRTEEARKRYPSKKFGYVKDKKLKQYKKNPVKEAALKQYFLDLTKVSSSIELENLLQTYKKELKTKADSLIKIARDPFYAGYDLTKGKNKLHHVEPYLTLEQYQNLQSNDLVLSKYEETKAILKEQNLYQPICGRCHKSMNFRYDITKESAWYTCSNKHSKVMISSNDLNNIMNLSLSNIIHKLDTEKLLKDAKQFFLGFKKSLTDELNILKNNKEDILKEIIINNEDLQSWREHPLYQEFIVQEKKLQHSLSKLESAEQQVLRNKNLAKLVKDYLQNSKISNPYFLYSMLIEKIVVYPNEVNLEINRFQYIQSIEKTLIFEGGMLVCKN